MVIKIYKGRLLFIAEVLFIAGSRCRVLFIGSGISSYAARNRLGNGFESVAESSFRHFVEQVVVVPSILVAGRWCPRSCPDKADRCRVDISSSRWRARGSWSRSCLSEQASEVCPVNLVAIRVCPGSVRGLIDGVRGVIEESRERVPDPAWWAAGFGLVDWASGMDLDYPNCFLFILINSN